MDGHEIDELISSIQSGNTDECSDSACTGIA
jgi:hypothetical protein